MIELYIKDLLATSLPSLEWSIQQYTGETDTGTVLSNSPAPSDIDDERDFMFPSYQVYLRSADYEKVEFYAIRVKEILDKRRDEIATRAFKDKEGNLLGTRSYQIIFIDCDDPTRIGKEGKNLDYSINFKTILKEVK